MSNINVTDNTNQTFQPFVSADDRGTSPYVKKENNKSTLRTLQEDTYETLKKKQRRINSLIAIGSTATIAAIAFIAVITGKSQRLSKKMMHLFGGVESKFSNVKDKHLHKILTTTFGVFEKFGKIVTNSSPIKDYTLHQALGKTKVTRRFRDFATNIFTTENKKSVNKSLLKSRESYNIFISSVEKAIKQSEMDPSLVKDKAEFQNLKQKMQDVRNTPHFLLPKCFEDAQSTMQNDMEFLSQEITLKRLFSKESLQGFVPESILAEKRSKYAKTLFDSKNSISYSFEDLSEYARTKLDETNLIIYSIKDANIQKKLRDCSINLDKSLKKYVKDSSSKESRSPNLNLIKNNFETFKKEVDLLVDSDIKKKLTVHINEYEDLFKQHNPGHLEEIRVLAGKAWGDKSEFDINIKKSGDNHKKDLNLSLTRMINMFDKQRDITLGSGPADLLGMLSPLVLFAVALGNADSKDKKIGTSLELGIPLIGGMLVYLRTLALQYNGVKALATSVGTGVLLNLAGSIIYKKYMAIQESSRERERASTLQQP